jgi:hypothetical protein
MPRGILNESRKSTAETRLCVGQQGAATTTEGVLGMHSLKRRPGGSAESSPSQRRGSRSFESCMGKNATCAHTTTTKGEEDRSADSSDCLNFAILRRTSDWLDRIVRGISSDAGPKSKRCSPLLAPSPPRKKNRNKNSRPRAATSLKSNNS